MIEEFDLQIGEEVTGKDPGQNFTTHTAEQ